MQKQTLLSELAAAIPAAINAGALPVPARIKQPVAIAGPRAGILRINAGMDNGVLYKALTANKKAKLRQLFPERWIKEIEPAAYLSGQSLCLECAWPAKLQTEMIKLSRCGQYPQTPNTFILGPNDTGITITLQLDQKVTQNLLIAGMSGGGKTITITSIVAQLARNDDTARFVLADGKGDLSHMRTLRGLVGPYASSSGEINAALRFVKNEMQQRNRKATPRDHPLYFVWDEPQELLLNDSKSAREFFDVVSQCRSANVKVIMATQSPKQELFGVGMTRGQFGAAVCHRMRDRHESEAALGDTEPRADHLTASGDAYVLAPGIVERVLVAYPDDSLIESVLGGTPERDAWPVKYEDIDTRQCPTPEQVAAGWYANENNLSRAGMRALGVSFENGQYSELKAFGAAARAAYDGLRGPSVEMSV